MPSSLTDAQKLQNLVDALRSLVTTYMTTEETLDGKLDNTHHAFVMPQYGECIQLRETIGHLKALVIDYDADLKTITFDPNGGSLSGTLTGPSPITAPRWKVVTLPTNPGYTPPSPELKFYGWCTSPTDALRNPSYGQGKPYEVVTDKTLYATWGPDPDYVPPAPAT